MEAQLDDLSHERDRLLAFQQNAKLQLERDQASEVNALREERISFEREREAIEQDFNQVNGR